MPVLRISFFYIAIQLSKACYLTTSVKIDDEKV